MQNKTCAHEKNTFLHGKPEEQNQKETKALLFIVHTVCKKEGVLNTRTVNGVPFGLCRV